MSSYFKAEGVHQLLPGDYVKIVEGTGIKGSGRSLEFDCADKDFAYGEAYVGPWRSSRREHIRVRISNLDFSKDVYRRDAESVESGRKNRQEFIRECLIS